MSSLVAIDVALLLPPDVEQQAVALSTSLPPEGTKGLTLGAGCRPHITLVQQFVREEELDAACAHVDDVLRGQAPVRVRVTGGGQGGSTLWMAVERLPELVGLHERLMHDLRGVERSGGGVAAFAGGDARVADVAWVTGYRLQSSFGHFEPHVTLGHGEHAPFIAPFAFDAATVAVCHLGRFCTCRRVLRAWTLHGAGPAAS
jgi:2'-5' RNA ligase